ncbi:hypothetical protein NDA16_002385 [Ustilago loliicola]|nr:hypothetical protein NDA16_002385 [Ustilago loliicola]
MNDESTPTDDTKPLVWLLDQDVGHLNGWLASHPPSRLGVPPAFNNGVVAATIWVLNLKTIDQLAELSPNAITNPTFIKANQLARDATAQVDAIQHDEGIPTKSNGKSPIKSKKQCRTEVQDQFHDQIMLMSVDHPLWNQGRWTLLVKPQNINETFATLANSLASGELQKHGSVIALRARALPPSESFFDLKKKSPSGRKSSSRSPTSARYANEIPLGIDIFFRPVWNSTAARDVLRVIAGVSGKMASFCKSSLYSRLGIRNDHSLGGHASLYNSKTLASPADAKLWVDKYTPPKFKADASGSFDMAESSKSANHVAASEAPKTEPDESTAATAKRELEREPTEDASAKSEEPALKKARNGDSSSDKEASATIVPAGPIIEQSQPETQESPDEPILPVRPTIKASDAATSESSTSLTSITEEEPMKLESSTPVPQVKPEEASQSLQPPSVSTSAEPKAMENDSQTQIEPSAPNVGAPQMTNDSTSEQSSTREEMNYAAKEPMAAEVNAAKDTTVFADAEEDVKTEAVNKAGVEEARESPSEADADVEMRPAEVKVQEETKGTSLKEVAETNESSAVEAKKSEYRQSSNSPQQEAIAVKADGEDVKATIKTEETSITKVVDTSQTVEVVIPSSEQRAQEPVAPGKESDTNAAATHQAKQPVPADASAAASAEVTLELKQPDADVKTTVNVTAKSKENSSAQSSNSQAVMKDALRAREATQPVPEKDAAPRIAETGNEPASYESDMIAAADAAESAGNATMPSAEQGSKPERENGKDSEAPQEVDQANAAESTAHKSKSQLSAGNGAEMTLDDLIVEGATASPIAGSQLLQEEAGTTAAKDGSEAASKDASETAVGEAAVVDGKKTDNEAADKAVNETGSK